jgi:hypothetical protein
LHKQSLTEFAQRTNLVAGGNATGSQSLNDPTLEGSNFKPLFFDPFRVGAGPKLSVGVAHGYSIQPLSRFG